MMLEASVLQIPYPRNLQEPGKRQDVKYFGPTPGPVWDIPSCHAGCKKSRRPESNVVHETELCSYSFFGLPGTVCQPDSLCSLPHDFVLVDTRSRKDLLAHGRGAALASLGLLGLLLGNALGKDLRVLVGLVLDLLGLTALERKAVALVLEALGGDQALDAGSLGVGLLALSLGLNLAADDVLADIVILGEAEETANLGGALGAEALGVDDVGEAGNVVVALLDDGEGKDREVLADDAATDGLALALTGAAGAVARVAVGEEQAGTSREHDTLLHGETLLVVATGDAEDVALELVTDGVAGNLSAHALLHEDGELALILNVDELLAAVGRVGDVQLHLAGAGWCKAVVGGC